MERPNIAERTVAYSLDAIRLYQDLKKDDVGRVIGRQLLRSSTSVGANVHEAQGGQSKADFICRMAIAYREARETAYWLRLVSEARLVRTDRAISFSNETEQLLKILASILLTARQNSRRK